MANAERKTRTARNLTIVTVVLGVIFLVLTIVLRVAALSKSSANDYDYQ
jgi:preprotein translocase subunit SecG